MTDIREELARALWAEREKQFPPRVQIRKFDPMPGDPIHGMADAALAWFREYLQRQEVVERALSAILQECDRQQDSRREAQPWDELEGEPLSRAALDAILPPTDAKTEKAQ